MSDVLGLLMDNAIRYEIIEEIARGDFATVCRGRDLQLCRDVAIKSYQTFRINFFHFFRHGAFLPFHDAFYFHAFSDG